MLHEILVMESRSQQVESLSTSAFSPGWDYEQQREPMIQEIETAPQRA